ncbi:free fatty acid receptor 3 [Rhynchocyon petersi]
MAMVQDRARWPQWTGAWPRSWRWCKTERGGHSGLERGRDHGDGAGQSEVARVDQSVAEIMAMVQDRQREVATVDRSMAEIMAMQTTELTLNPDLLAPGPMFSASPRYTSFALTRPAGRTIIPEKQMKFKRRTGKEKGRLLWCGSGAEHRAAVEFAPSLHADTALAGEFKASFVLLFDTAITMRANANQSFFPGNHWLYFSVYLFVFLVGLPLNLMALVIFVGKLRRRPMAVDVLLLNLTLSDLLLLFFLPFRMVEAASGMRWPLPFLLCPFSRFIFFTTIYLTSLFLAAVSIERFLSVAYPLWYKNRPRLGQACLVSGVCWLLAAGHCSVVYVTELSLNSSQNQSANGTCYLEFQEHQLSILLPVRLEMAVVLFGVPLLITSYCYSHLLWILSRGASQHRRRRVAGLVAATLLNFIVCFGPYNVSHIVGFVQGRSPPWRSFVLLLSTLNSCIDPLVYYFSSSGFQADFQVLLGRWAGACGLCRREGDVKLQMMQEGEGLQAQQELSQIGNR